MEHHRLFTIADLKDWIIYGKRKEGLCEEVITTTRAYSFINNPYVSDDMPVISALYVDNELAAYTAAFPEVLVKPKCTTHWFNSLYVAPKYEGKGYGLFVIGSLMECYGNDPVFDLDADELGKNFNFSENVQIKTGEYKKEIINYIIKNTSFESSNAYLYTQIEQKLEIINEQINLYDLCTSISNWYYEHINMIKQNDQRIKDEIWKLQINIPNKFNQTKRYLLSYSLQYDWEFIKKVKILEKDYKINQDDDGMIEENNFDDDLGNNYFGDLDNKGQGNNMNVDDGFNLKSSYFDC